MARCTCATSRAPQGGYKDSEFNTRPKCREPDAPHLRHKKQFWSRRPYGTCSHASVYPPLKRRAISSCPCGTSCEYRRMRDATSDCRRGDNWDTTNLLRDLRRDGVPNPRRLEPIAAITPCSSADAIALVEPTTIVGSGESPPLR